YEFKITPASKSSISKPCTNVPVSCPLCPTLQWKYNMTAHLHAAHPKWELTANDQMREIVDSRSHITLDEERRLGVPHATSSE
ncbi:hypothetical protein R3P38DRAFT_2391426, partial [Favolaschia claudopus]